MATRPISDIVGVWNQNSTFTGIGLNIKDTLSTSTSKLFNLQIDSGSKFNVDKSGNVVAVGTITSNKFTASYARIGAAPITSQYTFGDNTTPNLYSNKIRAYSASFTYLEIISGSSPRSKMPFINEVVEIKGQYDGYQGQANPNNTQNIRFTKNPNDDTPIIDIEVGNNLQGNFGAINVMAESVYVGNINTNPSSPNFNKNPIEIENGSISFNPKNPNDCIDLNGCLNISGNLKVNGMKIGPDSLYLSSSLTDSRIHGTNLSISSSLISASRMHVGGKTKTSQYKFYDGSKPDLYVNKLRAYSGSFTSLEIISGSEGSMSIKNSKGKDIFNASSGPTDQVTFLDKFAKFVSGSGGKDIIFGVGGKNDGKNTFKFDSLNVVYGVSCSLSGNLNVKGGYDINMRRDPGALLPSPHPTGNIQLATGSISLNMVDNGVTTGVYFNNLRMKGNGITSQWSSSNWTISGSFSTLKDNRTNYLGSHSFEIKQGAIIKVDGTNAPIELQQATNGAVFINFGRSLLKLGSQSLWITGSTISGSQLNLYAPTFDSKINVYHITGSSGKFNSFKFGAITASSTITASSAGASSGKYAKIKIGNQTYKILLYADS